MNRWSTVLALAVLVSIAGSLAIARTASAQAPVGAGFNLDAGDLRFIFRQIEIAQAHAAGGELLGPGSNQVNEPRLPFGLRTVDGSFNHLLADQTTFGAADQLFPRMTTPSFRAAEAGTSYAQKTGQVVDSRPRVISNLIVDQTDGNPAARAAAGPDAEPDPSGTLFIPNVAPDAGLSAPFNAIFPFFGQFFDHGLDLLSKGSETVFVPLQPDDPLFVPGSPTNFMILNRGANHPGPDGILGDDPATPGVDEGADDLQEGRNRTTPVVDQNQTYTSHPSHQVFLREYEMVGGQPVATGRVLGGVGGNIATWGEVKQQAAELLGIGLVDTDVLDVPQLATDPYGRFLRGPNGFPLLVMADGVTMVEGDPSAPLSTVGSSKTGHQFLDDIARAAIPTSPAYDAALLDAHFVTGDGRGNESIALTAVHTVFHSEHNRLRDNIDQLINGPGSLLTAEEITAWNTTDPASGWDYAERLFQAARFVTEVEYQHLVFEEFARKVQPLINPFIVDGINFQSEINPAIVAEFAHAVYRFGHSMLTETVSRTVANPDGTTTDHDIPLVDAFLNPLAFNNVGGQVLTAREAAGAIFQGGTRQIANEIDEFKTEALRNRLLGLPLDLAAINLTRGRSEGIPPLNAVRRQLYEISANSSLVPYESWKDFELGLRNRESVINFIAAYGQHPTLAAATTVAEKRAAAQALYADAGFMFGGAGQTGVENIDLWVGGLAEKQAPFGGLLGSTFNFVFETQLENLQNSDRFYYLERLDGLNLLVQLEGNSFAELISRNTTAAGMPADVFARPDFVLNVPRIDGPGGSIQDDPTTPDDESAMPDLLRMPDGTFRYTGTAHVVWNGRDDADDRLESSEGDDTLRGDGGNDRLEGGDGNDQCIGGLGDDILMDTFGDDVLKGGDGNDALSSGPGFDLNQGGRGKDYIVGGSDGTETFGGPGDDFIFAGDAEDTVFGDDGDDWIEGGPQLDLLQADAGNQFQNDPNGGHDVIIGGLGDDDYDSEGGDDIMVNDSMGTERNEGMLGFDWSTYRGDPLPVDADMAIPVLAPPTLDELRDRFDRVEGLSGWMHDDILRGDSRDAAAMIQHELTEDGSARIEGLRTLLGGATTFTGGNILLGGAGSDLIEGRGGDDILDGDAWLNVQIEGPDVENGGTRRADSMLAFRTDVFAGSVNPGNLHIRRTIELTGAGAADVDTALFSGPQSEYVVSTNPDGSLTVSHQDGAGVDGTDIVRNIEQLTFADGTIQLVSGRLLQVPGVVGETQEAATATIASGMLLLGDVTFENSDTVAAGSVIRQTPAAGETASPGSPVDVVVSLGPAEPVLAATVVGATLGARAVTSPSITPAANTLLVAYVATGGLTGAGTTVTGITNTGVPLTWTKAARWNSRRGTAEVWWAHTTPAHARMTVTANLSQFQPAALVVMAFANADPSSLAEILAGGVNGAPRRLP
ncbi:peroxidase family protein [Sorangium sp. So ce887]|uniref:peroxidase family protein n=1 Tax=Sorangium sp. So ce887 TaxID=3133324 RepID=UPI003F63FB05